MSERTKNNKDGMQHSVIQRSTLRPLESGFACSFISYCVVESTHLCTVNKKDKDEEIIFK